MRTRIVLSIAAVLMIVPASAQLNVDTSLVSDDDDLAVDTEVEAAANDTVETKVELQNGTDTDDGSIDARLDASSQFRLSDDRAEGRFIGLQISPQGIGEYRVGNDTFFAAIDLGALSAEADPTGLKASFAGGELHARDGAAAGLRVDAAHEIEAHAHLAPDVSAQQESDRLVWIEAGDRAGSLGVQGQGSITLDGSSLAIHLEPGAILRFEAQTGARADWRAEQHSFASGHLGAEVTITGGQAATDEYSVHVSDVRTGNGSVAFTVDADDPHARALTVAIDSALLADQSEMRFDGQAAVRVANASAVHAAASSSVATYSMAEVDGVVQAVVHVPGFSAHDIEFRPASQEAAPEKDTPGLSWIPLGGVVAVAALLRRLH